MAEELQFHSMDEARAYIKMELESQIAHGQRRTEAWRLAKRATWLLLLAVAYLQYYLFDIEVSRSSAFAPASANSTGSPDRVHTRCSRSPQKYRE